MQYGWVRYRGEERWYKAIRQPDGKVYRDVGLFIPQPAWNPEPEEVAATFAVKPWLESNAATEEQ